jgi:twinfilin-like protein
MARANLNIHTQINEEFLRANDSKDIRLLKVRIEDEILVLDGLVNMVGTAQQDFDTILLDSLLDNQASIVLFRVSTEVGEVAPWILIAWVPDGCRVRDKMLYSSSREDLKKSIGLSFFRGEYAANLRSDVTWKQFIASQDRTFDAEILTESERLVLEEKVCRFLPFCLPSD